jgi:hypothetical protein
MDVALYTLRNTDPNAANPMLVRSDRFGEISDYLRVQSPTRVARLTLDVRTIAGDIVTLNGEMLAAMLAYQDGEH